MADKAHDRKPDPAPAAPAEKKPSGGLLQKTPVVMGAVMIVEAFVLFAGFKILGGSPKHAVAIELSTGEKGVDGKGIDAGGNKKKLIEINIVDFKAPNTQNGRRYIYDVSIVAAARGEHEQKVRDAIKERDALIRDRVRTIVAQMDPEKLGGGSEPGLETLRRQVKYQLDEIIGDGMIDEVLVPKCIPFRADF
jgi:flagellar basal body-associated protein FliL